jgi:hypothetical protein
LVDLDTIHREADDQVTCGLCRRSRDYRLAAARLGQPAPAGPTHWAPVDATRTACHQVVGQVTSTTEPGDQVTCRKCRLARSFGDAFATVPQPGTWLRLK